jgi:peptide chain release factor 1
MNDLLTKLGFIADRYAEVGKQIVDPSIISDQQRYISLMKEYKELEDIVEV